MPSRSANRARFSSTCPTAPAAAAPIGAGPARRRLPVPAVRGACVAVAQERASARAPRLCAASAPPRPCRQRPASEPPPSRPAVTAVRRLTRTTRIRMRCSLPTNRYGRLPSRRNCMTRRRTGRVSAVSSTLKCLSRRPSTGPIADTSASAAAARRAGPGPIWTR